MTPRASVVKVLAQHGVWWMDESGPLRCRCGQFISADVRRTGRYQWHANHVADALVDSLPVEEV
jgi:hypothetical protein